MPSPAKHSTPGEAFRRHLRLAARQYRLERLARASWPLAWCVAIALLLLLALALTTPLVSWSGPIALTLLFIGVQSALVILSRRVDRHRLLTRMDAHAHLPDSILSAGDWENAALDPWRERQRRETLARLEKIDWRRTWPVRWPRFLWVPLLASLLLLTTICLVQWNRLTQNVLVKIVLPQEEKSVPTGQVNSLEQIFRDWDNAQKIAPSPELAALLKQIQPLRDQMTAGQMTEKQLFLQLNDVQARLQAERDRLEASSLAPLAESMAEAVQDLDGMSGLAAALQRKDFAAARDQAAQAQDKYHSGTAKMPEGEAAKTAANRLGDAAQKASASDKQASSSLRQMQNAISNKDSAGMAQALGGLKNSLAQQAQRQSQDHSLGVQLAQLGEYKDGLGKGDNGIKNGPPQLSLTKLLQEENGAGSGIDPNRFGQKTQLDASHQTMKITGTAGQGPSETQTESTNDPHLEKTASSVNAADFAAYKKLSEQATQDENLPVADRQMIKRYFEDIRPQSNPPR